MKMNYIRYSLCLVMFLLFTHQSWSADWSYFGGTKYGLSYYDKNSIKEVSKNIFRVWIKHIYNEDGMNERFERLKKNGVKVDKDNSLSYQLALYEIDCNNKKTRVYSVSIYSKNDDVVHTVNVPGNWEDIVPESNAEAMENAICRRQYVHKTKHNLNEIKLTKNGGVYEIPVTLNNVLNIYFILDSGASDVSI